MELSEMNLMDVEERLKALEVEVREMNEVADIEKATEEKKALLERKAELVDLEERKSIAESIENGGIENVKVVEERQEEMKMTDIEMRSSVEYGKAFLKGLKENDYTEARSLLSTNATSGGYVPVPTFLETEIKTAWEECQIVSLCKKSYLMGNVKVGFELSATGASVHAEGAEAPDEEVVTLGTVELKAESLKKWITISDEALEGTTVDTIGYLYAEIAQKIVELAESTIITKIASAPTASTSTACGVAEVASNPAVDTIVTANALLSGKAKNLNIAMNRQTYPAFVKLALEAGYAIDVFDGLKDKIVFTDALPAFSAASADDVYAIVGDFGYGFQANFPSGNEMTIKVDDLSLAEKDLVKLVGRQYVGLGVVAPKAFTKIKKVATA